MKCLADYALDPISNDEIEALLEKKDYASVLEHNILLVHTVAIDFRSFRNTLFPDLVQEGCMGLLRACELYEPNHGATFATYSIMWIKQRMRLYLVKEYDIRLPTNVFNSVSKYKKLKSELDREPTIPEVMEILGCSAIRVKSIRKAAKISYSEDSKCIKLAGKYKDSCPSLLIQESINRGWHLLNPREQNIVTMRFGLDGNPPQTLEEVSQVIGRTGERVRQIQNDALRKLKPFMLEHRND